MGGSRYGVQDGGSRLGVQGGGFKFGIQGPSSNVIFIQHHFFQGREFRVGGSRWGVQGVGFKGGVQGWEFKVGGSSLVFKVLQLI